MIRERPFDFHEVGWEDVLGPGNVFLLRGDPVFLFASNTKRTIAFTPVPDIFFQQDRVLEFFSSKNLSPTPHKNQMVAP